MSDSLPYHGQQHARHPRLSLSPGVCSNSCPLSRWCHPIISSSVTPSPALNLSQHQVFCFFCFFSKESAVRNRCPEYWYFRFSINPSNEYSELVSFRIDWFELKPLFVTVVPLLFMFWIFWPLGKRDLSPSTRNWTWVPCIGRQSLNYWTTWEVPLEFWNSDLRTKTHMCWYSCGIET